FLVFLIQKENSPSGDWAVGCRAPRWMHGLRTRSWFSPCCAAGAGSTRSERVVVESVALSDSLEARARYWCHSP
ncbi:MAG: hypothetical protein AAB343_03925, partial [Patescibacteria group bacterium]